MVYFVTTFLFTEVLSSSYARFLCLGSLINSFLKGNFVYKDFCHLSELLRQKSEIFKLHSIPLKFIPVPVNMFFTNKSLLIHEGYTFIRLYLLWHYHYIS